VLAVEGEAGDDHALDERVRVALHERAVLERARLALVGVAHDVDGLAGALRDERPLEPGGEPGAAAAAQPSVLDDLDDVTRRHRERAAQACIAAVRS
jgi:hypothetical protein